MYTISRPFSDFSSNLNVMGVNSDFAYAGGLMVVVIPSLINLWTLCKYPLVPQ